MKKIITASLLFLLASLTAKAKETKKIITARITYYSSAEDVWKDKIALPSYLKKKLNIFKSIEGKTVATGKEIPFGAKINIIGLKGINSKNLIAVDTGTDVKSKKACKNKSIPVIDCFLFAHSRKEGEAKIRYMASINDEYMQVQISY